MKNSNFLCIFFFQSFQTPTQKHKACTLNKQSGFPPLIDFLALLPKNLLLKPTCICPMIRQIAFKAL